VCWLMQRPTSLMHTSELKILLNLPLIILVLTMKIFCNVKIWSCWCYFYSRPAGSCVASMKFFGAKHFEFQRATVFCLGQYISKCKTTRNARNLGAMPFGYAYARGQTAWSLRATWCPWAPLWWPLILECFFQHMIWYGPKLEKVNRCT